MAAILRPFGFREAYDNAGAIRHIFVEKDEDERYTHLGDYFPSDDAMRSKVIAPKKKTLLHEIIESYVSDATEYYCDKGDPDPMIEDLDLSFRAHGVEVPPDVRALMDERNKEGMEAARVLYGQHCLPKITTEVFTLLFADRPFLLALNERFATLIRPLKQADNVDLLERDGVVKRATYWPTWLRRGLVYRDRGHCAICLNDISGLVALGEKGYHVDHIVPLDAGGTNDPVNLQLLCDNCNLKKGAGKANTASVGMVYWAS